MSQREIFVPRNSDTSGHRRGETRCHSYLTSTFAARRCYAGVDPGFRLRAITEQPVFLIAPRLRNVRTSRGHAYASIIASYRLAFRLTTRGLINLYTLSLTRPNLSKSSELKRKAIEARSSYPWKLNSRWFYRYTCVGEVSIL